MTKILTSDLIEDWIKSRPDGQLYFDLDNDNDFQILLFTINLKNNDTVDSLIDRIADFIEISGTLADEPENTVLNAIIIALEKMEITFKSNLYRQIFINSMLRQFD